MKIPHRYGDHFRNVLPTSGWLVRRSSCTTREASTSKLSKDEKEFVCARVTSWVFTSRVKTLCHLTRATVWTGCQTGTSRCTSGDQPPGNPAVLYASQLSYGRHGYRVVDTPSKPALRSVGIMTKSSGRRTWSFQRKTRMLSRVTKDI